MHGRPDGLGVGWHKNGPVGRLSRRGCYRGRDSLFGRAVREHTAIVVVVSEAYTRAPHAPNGFAVIFE